MGPGGFPKAKSPAFADDDFTAGPTAKYGNKQRMFGQMLWPLIRNHCLVHDKYYAVPDVPTVRLQDPKCRVGAG